MKARLLEAAGAGAPVSGALAALLLAAAALLLVPGAAWAQGCGATSNGISSDTSLTCADQAHNNVRFNVTGSASLTVTAPGGPATVVSGTSTSFSIAASSNAASGNYAIILGTAGAVSVTGSGRGVNMDKLGGAGTATVDIRSTVTIGVGASRGRRGVRVG